MNPTHCTSYMSYLLHSSVPPPPPLQLARHNLGYTNSHTTTEIPTCSSWRCSPLCAHPRDHHSLCLLLPTDLGCHPLTPPLPNQTHDTATSAILTLSRPPNYLPEAPGGARRFPHLRVAGAPSRPLVPTDLGCHPLTPPLPNQTHTTTWLH